MLFPRSTVSASSCQKYRPPRLKKSSRAASARTIPRTGSRRAAIGESRFSTEDGIRGTLAHGSAGRQAASTNSGGSAAGSRGTPSPRPDLHDGGIAERRGFASHAPARVRRGLRRAPREPREPAAPPPLPLDASVQIPPLRGGQSGPHLP